MEITDKQKEMLERTFASIDAKITFDFGITIVYNKRRFSAIIFDNTKEEFVITTTSGTYNVEDARHAMNELAEDIAIAQMANRILDRYGGEP